MRIAFVTTSWPTGEQDPSGHFVRAHARELERGGDIVTVVAPEAGGAFGWPGAPARIREKPLRALGAARWVAAARKRVRQLEVDRVVAHWAVPCGWPIATGARGRIDVVSHGGDVRLLLGLPGPARRAIVRAVAGKATSWQFVSTDLLDDLLGALDHETRARV